MSKLFKITKSQVFLNFISLDLRRKYSANQLVKYPFIKHGNSNICSVTLNLINNKFSHNRNRQFITTCFNFSEESDVVEAGSKEEEKPIDPSKDRTKIISPETSIRYLKSEAYKTTYGDEPVWVKYRRNFKGQFLPKRTRKTCIRKGVISTGSPCPICRDEYLVLHYTNVDLLKQFISPYTGEIYDLKYIHVCQKKLLELEVAVKLARFHGYLTYNVPFRKYDYKEFYPALKE